jgi:hypothetical protein
MSEYWVSQAKYYCKVCNCYIADNKPSRSHHENGVKHKEKVEQMLKQKRMDKLHGARSESELKKQLADIEKAAKEAIAVDRTEHDGSFYQVRRAVTANCPTWCRLHVVSCLELWSTSAGTASSSSSACTWVSPGQRR